MNYGGSSGGSVSTGSYSNYKWNPWGTMPFVQLPNWSISIIYAVAIAIAIGYAVVLYGASVFSVSTLANRAYGKLMLDSGPFVYDF